ncbi:GlsB/YeaQ/YmgE family stress response membrane protein [Mesorhizobium sp. ESP-6-4]|uniref:GlsB/YeaQ/YmgE family stress response membrane protein n=1 Tax=Mesorhizobium argentiipisi TaxID=3015175 RepID=A0ABU8KEZ9_9HYPH|nr:MULTISPECIES: GlsB/YeaQ/YmgE family stress response membrane protein [unclassified Mesorhizobium]MBZ9660663.1 GlsB/YeaQ/YmgE family stress response membrane protein [Mesorhizobium sp. ESP-6-4]MBZ9735660.1 GlsB/YeaQ/YmgE family stress response membrane protein [Mesorhizobium sp. CA9]MBZ9759610.1 GlsB/YeaQ/YmgE family stress response membrane protein [Mesorhizobium sp. CA8]MBZ9821744.1 GlsB/YeaQ/YmgE family stress response membrane protein [Mesorhizobium sp. CA4]MBZ9827531.1 GlsB/YeaQ/YmgE fa
MHMNGVGWIAAIIVGGLAGWLAEMVMKSNTGIFMNIIMGIVGAIVLNAILQALNIQSFGVGWVAYLITGFIGACLLIFVGRLVRR